MLFDLRALRIAISCGDAVLRYYAYRRAMVEKVVAVLKDYPIESSHLLQSELAVLSGSEKNFDNHTVFAVTFKDGSTFAFGFSDEWITLGTGVREEAW